MAGKKRKRKSSVVPIKVTNSLFLNFVRRAVDRDDVGYDKHAAKRMVQRGITPVQVLRGLRGGVIIENAHEDVKGRWKATLQGGMAEVIRVTVRISRLTEEVPAIVVTAFKVNR